MVGTLTHGPTPAFANAESNDDEAAGPSFFLFVLFFFGLALIAGLLLCFDRCLCRCCKAPAEEEEEAAYPHYLDTAEPPPPLPPLPGDVDERPSGKVWTVDESGSLAESTVPVVDAVAVDLTPRERGGDSVLGDLWGMLRTGPPGGDGAHHLELPPRDRSRLLAAADSALSEPRPGGRFVVSAPGWRTPD